jgi:hypothetical protein
MFRAPIRRIKMTLGSRRTALALAAALALLTPAAHAQQMPPGVTAPQPTVPMVFTIMGKYVRVAYNNQGFVTLGYQAAQQTQGEDWMLLEVGLTVRDGSQDATLERKAFSVKTPEGTVIPLASQSDYASAGHLRALNNRAKVQRDSINYFPVDVQRGCALGFFADPGGGAGPRLSWDKVELTKSRACVGRLFFKIPGGIKTGQYWLYVDFPDGQVQVPFRILTKEEAKAFDDSWEDIKKAHDASYNFKQ